MPIADRDAGILLIVDFQARLMPAIQDGEAVVANARRLIEAARLLSVPMIHTEQNPKSLGGTIETLAPPSATAAIPKMSFDAWRVPEVRAAIPAGRELVVTGCEAHVCVLQTVLGALADGHRVKVVRDAVGSRREESRAAALDRMARHGADIVTTEMMIFEWIGDAENPVFKRAIALIK